MKKKILLPVLTLGLLSILFVSCSKDSEPLTTEDAGLIAAIEEATNKQSILQENLPPAALSVLNSEYEETYISEAQLAPELGYKVSARMDDPTQYEQRYLIYFDMDGRHLIDRDRPYDGIDWCFRFIFPISVTYINGEIIELTNFQQLRRLAKSCDRGHHCFEFNYPIYLKLGDRRIEINSNEELRRAFNRCDRIDRPRDVPPRD
jgi:hypothetical protein